MFNSFYIKTNNILAKIQELEELRQDSYDDRDRLILDSKISVLCDVLKPR